VRGAIAPWLCAFGLASCTTSTAVLTWHDAWRAEQTGDLERAERAYAAAFELDPGLVGAECNRIRLVAAHPDRAAQAQASLDKLVKAKASAPEVASTAALAALADGKPDLARKRLDAARKVTDKDRPDVVAARRTAEVRVAVALERHAEALAAAEGLDLADLATTDRETLAVAAWNAQDSVRAAQFAPPGSESALWAAFARADLAEVVRRSARLDKDRATAATLAIAAWAHGQTGAGQAARAWLAEGVARDPHDATVTQVVAALALLDGQPAAARDTLTAATARAPTAPWTAWFNLGIAQLRLGDAPAAHASFARAATACPACAQAVRNRDALAALVGAGP